jgi:hypothetical protein
MRSVKEKQQDHACMRLLMADVSSVGADRHAHRRLLMAVISFAEACEGGAKAEVRAAAIALREATIESQNLLCPTEVPHD